MDRFFLQIGFLLFNILFSFENQQVISTREKQFIQKRLNFDPDTVFEFKRGDIIVKPNHNWLPGTSMVMGGKGFGHAAIVLKGAKDKNLTELLKKTVIFESHARDVPVEFQVRKFFALKDSSDIRFSNMTFGPINQGNLYRLRGDLTDRQIDKIIDFIQKQDASQSSWRAQKRFSKTANEINPEKETWYCSLLIWQAFYDVLEIDLDSNGGVMVYPNDLITSGLFNSEKGKKKRVRF